MNTFLHPYAKDGKSIKYLTGCLLPYYWEVCDILREEGVEEGTYTYFTTFIIFFKNAQLFKSNFLGGIFTFPVLVLLTFMRLRMGLPFTMLEILFDCKGLNTLHDRFWQTAIIYFSRCNPIPKMFSDINVTGIYFLT